MRSSSARRTAAVLAAMAVLGACRDGTGAMPVAQVDIILPFTQVVVGDAFQAQAVAYDAQGNVIASPPAPTWTSTTPGVASVNATTGQITALAPGTTTLRAQVGAGSASLALTVAEDLFANCGMRTIAIGATHNGTLGQGPCVLNDGTFIDLFELTVTAQRTVTINMTSSAFDTYLILWDRVGNWLTENDDISESNTNSRIVRSLAPGRYVIAANAYSEGESGAYTLTVQ